MNELVFELTGYFDERFPVTQQVRAPASTQEEARNVLERLFKPRVIQRADGGYRMFHTLEVRVLDGRGLIE